MCVCVIIISNITIALIYKLMQHEKKPVVRFFVIFLDVSFSMGVHRPCCANMSHTCAKKSDEFKHPLGKNVLPEWHP